MARFILAFTIVIAAVFCFSRMGNGDNSTESPLHSDLPSFSEAFEKIVLSCFESFFDREFMGEIKKRILLLIDGIGFCFGEISGVLTLSLKLVILALALCLIGRCCPKEKPIILGLVRRSYEELGYENPPSSEVHQGVVRGNLLTAAEIRTKVTNFSNPFARGCSGKIYRGFLDIGTENLHVAVKQVSLFYANKRDLFKRELDLFLRRGVSHARIIPLIGYCVEEKIGYLVYPYKGGHDLQTRRSLGPIEWSQRVKIALGVSEALSYLHNHNTTLVHRDVRQTSILLDDNLEVSLGSLHDVCDQSEPFAMTKFLKSKEPKTTCAHDVYCLGKVLLTLVTNEDFDGVSKANLEYLEERLSLVRLDSTRDMKFQVIDPYLQDASDDQLKEFWAMALLAKACLSPEPSKRPLIQAIVRALKTLNSGEAGALISNL